MPPMILCLVSPPRERAVWWTTGAEVVVGTGWERLFFVHLPHATRRRTPSARNDIGSRDT
jgi:hypothetical protein